MANVLPGALPVGVNGIRVAASVRPRKFVIEGGDETPVTMPRTAFQVVYPDCIVMIDSGLDKATHDSFSPDKPEPYFPEDFAKLERALDAARLIVLTHYHADHVAGVVTRAEFRRARGKTIVSTQTRRPDGEQAAPAASAAHARAGGAIHRARLSATAIRSRPAWC